MLRTNLEDQLMEKTTKAHQREKEIKKRRVSCMSFQANFQADWDAINEKKQQAAKIAETDEMKID